MLVRTRFKTKRFRKCGKTRAMRTWLKKRERKMGDERVFLTQRAPMTQGFARGNDSAPSKVGAGGLGVLGPNPLFPQRNVSVKENLWITQVRRK